MPLWDKVKQELDRAGRVAQEAIDDGKDRLDAFRSRQLADKAAQALGYAVYRAKQAGHDLDAATYDRLSAALATHEAEASRLEAQFDASRRASETTPDSTSTSSSSTMPHDTPATEPPAAPDTQQTTRPSEFL